VKKKEDGFIQDCFALTSYTKIGYNSNFILLKVMLPWTFQATLVALGSMYKISPILLKFGRYFTHIIQDANVKQTNICSVKISL